MNKLSISIITFFPPSRGRLAEYAYYLVDELQRLPKLSHIDIVADITNHRTIKKISSKITLYRTWKPDNITSLAFIPFKILRLKPDIVHFNVHMAVFGRSRLANFIGLSLPFLCRLMGFRTLVTLHNITEKIDVEKCGYKNNFINRLGSFIATKLLTLASAITVNVRSHVKILRKKYKCERVWWIPHGTWKVNLPNTRNLTINPTILYIGHSGPYKDLDLLFKAFRILSQKRRDVKLFVVGNSHPNYPNFLDEYKSKNNLSNVQFTGYVPEDQLSTIFGKASVVVLPYHTCTGTSGVAHLAASYGVPIIATDLPEFHELVEEGCGIFLSPHNPEALAERIEYILNNHNMWRELKKQNLSFAQGRTWNKIALSFCKVYEQITERR